MAESTVSIRIETRGQQKLTRLEKSLKRVDRVASDAGRELGRLTKSFSLLNTAIAAVGVGVVVNQIASIGRAAITAAGDVQKLEASFVGLTGSVETAKELRNILFQLSKTTPFKNEEILQSARRFLAVGVSVENLEGTLNRVGALAAQNGTELSRLGLIYSQIYAKGRLQAEENLQLLEAGVSITKELEQVTGLSGKALQDAMSKGQISVKNVNDALKLATGEMTALDLAAQSVSVSFENIGDNVSEIGKAFSVSLAPAFNAVFSVINDAFDRLFPSLDAVQDRFDPLLEQAERFAEIVEDNPELVDAIASAFDSLLNFFLQPAVEAAEDLNDQLDKNPQGLIETIQAIELGIRKSLTAAAGLVKILEGARRLGAGGLVRGEAGNIADLLRSGVEDLQRSSELKPFEIKTFTKPEVSTRRGNLDDGRGNPKGNDGGLTDKEIQRTRDLTAKLQDQNRVREEVLRLERQINDAKFAGNDILATQLRFQQEIIKIAGATAEKLKGVTDEELRAAIVREGDLKIAKTKIKFEDELRRLRVDGATDAARAETKLKEAREGALGPLEKENELLQARLNGTEEQVKRAQQIAELVKKGTVTNKDGSTTQTVSTEEAAAIVDTNNKLKAQVEQLKQIDALYEQIGSTIKAGIVDGIVAAVEGGKDLQQILADTLRSVGKMLINAGVSGLGQTAGIPGFSEGGIAPGKTVSLVGENGPELIRPMTPTLVSPFDENSKSLANELLAATTDQAYADNEAAIANSNSAMTGNIQAKEFQATMARMTEEPVRVDAIRVGDMDVVSTQQLNAAVQQGAKQARAQVYRDLKNKPASRAGVGL